MAPTSDIRLVGPNGMVATSVRMATTFRSRRRGVLGSDRLRPDEAVVIRPCRQIHTHGVGYALDAVFCDARLMVLDVQTVPDGSVSSRVGRAKCCIELLGGRASECGITTGVVLRLEGEA